MFVMLCFFLLSVMSLVGPFLNLCVLSLCRDHVHLKKNINPIFILFFKEVNVMTSKARGKKRRRERCLAFENKEERDGNLKTQAQSI
jgi:hypothetical protein